MYLLQVIYSTVTLLSNLDFTQALIFTSLTVNPVLAVIMWTVPLEKEFGILVSII
jgi:hypothetical protein